MELKAGSRLVDEAGTAELIVVRAPGAEVSFSFDHPEASGGEATILLGKRYVDEDSGTELLCSKAGPGAIVIDGRVLDIKSAKPLPASD